MSKKIILSCTPPLATHMPSPGLSVLKANLNSCGFDVSIIYWNILLYKMERDFLWESVMENTALLYAAYFALKQNNISLYNYVKTVLKSISPIMLNENPGFYDKHIKDSVKKLDNFIDRKLKAIDFEHTLFLGFQMKMDQWVVASFIAGKIKQMAPNIPIVVGGLNSPSMAKSFLIQFPQFNIATWGEGEYVLENLADFLLSNNDFSNFNVPNCYYRQGDVLTKSRNTNLIIADLSANECYPDFDDYFKHNQIDKTSIILPIEGGRGCHWNKCHFCYLNFGYKHRLKNVEKIYQEIKYMIERYRIYKFEFLDNDIIGGDFDRFKQLLSRLIKIKKEYPEFVIVAVEIITSGLAFEIIKMMSEAGIVAIQLGYESASDSLLKKINKKNTFASNFNCIKHCMSLKIAISGANVIQNLLEETDEDIQESIENLRFFRFILCVKNLFLHIPIPLTINSSSKYYNKIKDQKDKYEPSLISFHKSFYNNCGEEIKWCLFEFTAIKKNELWVYFENTQYHYIKNNYTYNFIEKNGSFVYQEYFNDDIIETIDFSKTGIEIKILNAGNNQLISLDELRKIIPHSIGKIKKTLDYLFEKGLIYRSASYNEIVSVVNPEKRVR